MTKREEQVVSLVANGCTNQEISDRLYISINTVKVHIRDIMRKTNVSKRQQLALWAIENAMNLQVNSPVEKES